MFKKSKKKINLKKSFKEELQDFAHKLSSHFGPRKMTPVTVLAPRSKRR